METFVTCSRTAFECSVPENSVPKKQTNLGRYVRPLLASIVVSLSSLAVGTVFGYPSPAIPNINSHRNVFHLNTNEQSWFGSIIFVGGLFTAFVSSFILDKCGRKLSLMLALLPMVFGWVIISSAVNIPMMYLGRLLTGFSMGIQLSTISIYVSEISPPEIRGILSSFHEFSVGIGILLTYIIGIYVPWNWLAIFCASVPVLQMILLIFIPETPRWLVFKGMKEAAADSLVWFQGSQVDVEHKILDIQQNMKDAAVPVSWLEYVKPPLWRSLFVSQLLFIVQGLSGINIIRMYTVSIFQESGSQIDPNVETVIVGSVMIFGSCIHTSIVERFERRTLLIMSCIMIGFSMAATGAFFVVKDKNLHFAEANLDWLPLLALITATVGYVVGCGPLPFVMTSELFSTRTRGRASSLCIVNLNIFGFLSSKFFSNVSEGIGEGEAFFIFSGACFIGTVIVFFTVPETKGKSLEEIQQNLNSKN